MMLFSSRPPFNDDPRPNVWEGHSEYNQMRADTDMYRHGAPYNHKTYRNRPRPEFDRPQSNPVNPILVWFREASDGSPKAARYVVEHWGDTVGYAVGHMINPTNAHVDHARRVLNRLARLA